MKKRDWLVVALSLIATWGLDRITKQWALDIQGVNFYGLFGLVLHHNPGAMLGLFSDLPPLLRVVSLSTGGGFLIFLFVMVQYLLPIKSVVLRSGLSILLGGILGNVTDRIIWGYVVDFLLLGTPKYYSPAFNLADAFQWVGYFMVVYALIKEREVLWPTHNVRRSYWINPKFQLRYCLFLMAIGACFSTVLGIYAYTYLRVTIINIVGHDPLMLDRYLVPFIITFVIVSLSFSSMLFLMGKIVSHRTAGPLYAFEKYLEDLIEGKGRSFKLRTGDEFRHLEELARKLGDKVSKAEAKTKKNSA